MSKKTPISQEEYNEKLSRSINSLHRVATKLKLNPLELSRDTWRKHRLPSEPSHTIIQQLGGWQTVRSLAMKDTPELPDVPPIIHNSGTPDELVYVHRKDLQVRSLTKLNKTLVSQISSLEDSLEVLTNLRQHSLPPPPVVKREKKSNKREATAVILCSDWHTEERVFPEQVNGRNAYSPDIARARAQTLVEGIIWLLDLYGSRIAIRDLVLWLGGDIITGFIHEELQETNTLTPIEATLFCQELIANTLIQPLLDKTKLERLILPCSYGNHGRTHKRKQYKNAAKNSYEWLIYHTLRDRFKDEERIEFQIANGAHLHLNVYDWKLRFHHGDDVKFWGGSGGLTVPVNKAIDRWNDFEHADITCIGHFHQYLSLPWVVSNGSLIGYNEFALAIKAKYEPPQQAFFLIDSERGKRHSTRIWVEDKSLEDSARESWNNSNS